MVRKFLVFLAASFLTLFLFLTVFSTTTVLVFTSDNLKTWLNESGFYENVVDGIIEQQDDLISVNEKTNVNLKDPRIQAIFKNVITAEFIKTSSEDAINSIDSWLKGDTETPDFSINIAQIKNNIAESIGDYAQERYDALPLCKSGQITTNEDVLTILCRIPGYNPKDQIAKAVSDLKNNEDFLPDSTLSADSIKLGTDSSPLFTKIDSLPQTYQRVKLAPVVLSILSLIAIVLIMVLTKDKRRGLKRIMLSLYAVVFILLVEIMLVSLAINTAESKLTKEASGSPSLQEIGLKIVQAIQNDINHYLILFIFGFVVPAVAISIYLLVTRSKKPKTPSESPKMPGKTEESQTQEESSESKADNREEKPKTNNSQKLVQ